jgi:PD-(D/E)XK nuclease superfamily
MTRDALATVHPAIIESLISPFLRLLQQFISSPPVRTVRTRAARPLEVSRAADLRTLRSLSRRPLELAGLRGLELDVYSPNARTLIDQPDNAATLDHPVTRYVAFLLRKICVRLHSTSQTLRLSSGHGVPDPAAKTYARELADRVDGALHEIQSIQRARAFRYIQPEALSDTALQVLPDHPLYLAIHRVGCRLAEPGLAYAPGQDIVSALKHSYDLFELAVLYRLVTALGETLGPSWRPLSSASVRRHPHEDRPSDRSSWSWGGPGDESVELVYQAPFNAATSSASSNGFASISGQYVPDFVIIYRQSERPSSWMILDAKYRSGRQSVHDGLSDIHRYRDALRLSGRAASAAYIIVPALQEQAALYGTGSYHQAYGFGAISIYEKDWGRPIRDWLAGEQSKKTA